MDDQYVLDLELGFTDGSAIYEQLTEGRDRIENTDNLMTVVINVSASEQATYQVRRSQLNYTKITRRKLEPDHKRRQ